MSLEKTTIYTTDYQAKVQNIVLVDKNIYAVGANYDFKPKLFSQYNSFDFDNNFAAISNEFLDVT